MDDGTLRQIVDPAERERIKERGSVVNRRAFASALAATIVFMMLV